MTSPTASGPRPSGFIEKLEQLRAGIPAHPLRFDRGPDRGILEIRVVSDGHEQGWRVQSVSSGRIAMMTIDRKGECRAMTTSTQDAAEIIRELRKAIDEVTLETPRMEGGAYLMRMAELSSGVAPRLPDLRSILGPKEILRISRAQQAEMIALARAFTGIFNREGRLTFGAEGEDRGNVRLVSRALGLDIEGPTLLMSVVSNVGRLPRGVSILFLPRGENGDRLFDCGGICLKARHGNTLSSMGLFRNGTITLQLPDLQSEEAFTLEAVPVPAYEFEESRRCTEVLLKVGEVLRSARAALISAEGADAVLCAVRRSQSPLVMQIVAVGMGIDEPRVRLATVSGASVKMEEEDREFFGRFLSAFGDFSIVELSERSRIAAGIAMMLRRAANLERAQSDLTDTHSCDEGREFLSLTNAGVSVEEMPGILGESPALAPDAEVSKELRQLLEDPILAREGEHSKRESANVAVELLVVRSSEEPSRLVLRMDAEIKLNDRRVWLDTDAIIFDAFQVDDEETSILMTATEEIGQVDSDPLVEGKLYRVRPLDF